MANLIVFGEDLLVFGNDLLVFGEDTSIPETPLNPTIPPIPTGVGFDTMMRDMAGFLPSIHVRIVRSNPRYKADGSGIGQEFINVVSGSVECILSPQPSRQDIQPSGEVITSPVFKIRFFRDYPDVQEGDIVLQDDKPRLFVDSVYRRPGVDYLSVELVQTQR